MNFQPPPVQDPLNRDIKIMSPVWILWLKRLTDFIVKPIVNYIQFDKKYTGTVPTTEGTLSWNAAEHTLNLQSEFTGSSLQVGRENWTRVVNKSGSPISDGTVVYISGAQGNRPTVLPAKADSETTSYVIGVMTADIAVNGEGYATVFGELHGFDTRGTTDPAGSWVDGQPVFLSAVTAGVLTKVRPSAPNHGVFIGFALNTTVNGVLFINPDYGSELDELHDVLIAGKTYGDFLSWDNTAGVWKNKRTIGDGTNQTKFEADGTIVCEANATGWKDIHFMQSPPKTTGAGTPTLTTWNTVFDGYSYALGAFHTFDPQEYDHAGVVGATTAQWHIHFVTRSVEAVKYIKFQLEYAQIGFNGTFPVVTPISSEFTVPLNTPANTHHIFGIGTAFTTLTPGSFMVVKLTRIATTGVGDPTLDPIILGVQYHYPIDTPAGSRLITAK